MDDKEVLFAQARTQSKLDAILLEREPQTTKEKRDEFADRAIRVVVALQSMMTKANIIKAFRASGEIPPDGKDFLDTKMSALQADLSLIDWQAYRDAYEGGVNIMRQKGMLTEADMDALGVPKTVTNDRRSKPKDQRPLPNQRGTKNTLV